MFYDEYMCAEKLHDLLMLDDTISGIAKANICGEFPYSNDEQIASFIGRLIHFILQRKFIKHGFVGVWGFRLPITMHSE